MNEKMVKMTPRGENMITGYPLEMKKFIHKVTEAKKKKGE